MSIDDQIEMLIASIICISAVGLPVRTHSALACTELHGTDCLGFPRYYHFNTLPTPLPSSNADMQFYASRDRQTQMQPGIDTVCPDLTPLQEYTEEYPMAIVKRGSVVTLQHPPRGHADQPSSNVWVYMYPIPNEYPVNKQLPADEFELLAEYPFDNCIGLEQEVSWANCTGTIQIPHNITKGIYTFWWRWDLNGIPYSDCFDVLVN